MEIEIEVDVRWNSDKQCFIARCEEFMNCAGEGRTPFHAINALHTGIKKWMNILKTQQGLDRITP